MKRKAFELTIVTKDGDCVIKTLDIKTDLDKEFGKILNNNSMVTGILADLIVINSDGTHTMVENDYKTR